MTHRIAFPAFVLDEPLARAIRGAISSTATANDGLSISILIL
jgi:hypothetical protein